MSPYTPDLCLLPQEYIGRIPLPVIYMKYGMLVYVKDSFDCALKANRRHDDRYYVI